MVSSGKVINHSVLSNNWPSGVHHGATKVPQEESDPRIEIEGEPNFYYPQEDLLWDFCKRSRGQTAWTVCMPGPILGGVPDAAMNLAFPLAVYAAVTKQLNEVLQWPGDPVAWQSVCSMSSSMMNGRLSPYPWSMRSKMPLEPSDKSEY